MVCALRKPIDKELRIAYESFLGDRIGDTTWRSLKKFLLECELEINADNLCEYANLRRSYPKLSLTPLEFRAILAAFNNAKKIIPNQINGEQFVNLIVKQQIKPDISTIYRWFNHADSKYSKSRVYPQEVIFSVMYRAVIWKFIDTRKNSNG